MRIKIKKEKCSGCHLCEAVCSLFHLGVINLKKSAIFIQKDDLDASLNVPLLCRQCVQMSCLKGGKFSLAREKKEFIWPAARAKKCPFHALPITGRQSFHCDLCGGRPQCIKVCTPGAITLDQRKSES